MEEDKNCPEESILKAISSFPDARKEENCGLIKNATSQVVYKSDVENDLQALKSRFVNKLKLTDSRYRCKSGLVA